MSWEHDVYSVRAWMYNRRDPESREVRQEYKEGVQQFLTQAINYQRQFMQNYGTNKVVIFCPCAKCKNVPCKDSDTVYKHLMTRGFMPNYFVWFFHGEDFVVNVPGSSSSMHNEVGDERMSDQHNDGEYNYQSNQYGYGNDQDGNRFHDMVTDAFHENTAAFNDTIIEEPNQEARRFYEMLDAANEPLYEGCREGLSKLSLASRMMTIKSEHNESEVCMDKWAALIKDILPEGNNASESYYEIQKLVSNLGLPAETIDVCIDYCMLFWRDDGNLQACRFCGKPRYKDTGGRTKVAYQRMWYLPITDRLKRLYQSDRTAASMRWHAEHNNEAGVVTHPSDAKAWKHFNKVHSEFAEECRNVYLGLCTDGFTPFGMSGRQYSLWPVIVTPYNLPPDMCMQREFLFLSILVPGPNHPKRSLDVFLQPLIHELQMLWETGARTFDASVKRNFNMRAVLMWTISDFPAYGMLSGWTTHGRLSCPYCLDKTDAFQLKNGRKVCWFDCHRRFLPLHHPYRRNKRLFTKNKSRKEPPPIYQTGEQLYQQLDYFGAQETVERGGNWFTPGNMPDGYSVHHNWHKKSIFWELPYWKDHLLRHNLDVMHIEKNFFDNIIHTLLNVQKKTKDNFKSRMDLPDICSRSELHLTSDGKAPIPNFRLSAAAKESLFEWVRTEVNFPDGYVSKFSRCIENGQKFSGMKSHDCHVFMQRLFPFALKELLPPNVHDAIAAIGAFFRDLCARTLTEENIAKMDANIALIICNLEKIFPPSFFDVMEHLPVHLPHEADLGGPVHFRWMYPFERFMKYLKKMAKNLAKVEGSIVAGSLTEETANFSSYYFGPSVQTRRTTRRRYDDGGTARSYIVEDIPDVFCDVGRMGGKVRQTEWQSWELMMAAHTYIMLNCDYFRPYEMTLEAQIREAFPELTDVEVRQTIQRDFASWMKNMVTKRRRRDVAWPLWVHEVVQGPIGGIKTSKMYCTRGFTFHTYEHGRRRSTANYGIHVPGDPDYYGILKEIIELEYGGMVNLKCVVFHCDWFDTSTQAGHRRSNLGVVDVNAVRRLPVFEPFILASQAEQVCFLTYPRVRARRDQSWLSVIKINPRGRIIGLADDVAMQCEHPEIISIHADSSTPVNRIDPLNMGLEPIAEESEGQDEEDDFTEFSSSDDEGDEDNVAGEDEDEDVYAEY